MYNFIVKIRLVDESNFDPDRCANGGAYAFWKTFAFDANTKKWYYWYGTTSDFDYCPRFGDFGDCQNCRFRQQCEALNWAYPIKNIEVMREEIKNWLNNSDNINDYVEVICGDSITYWYNEELYQKAKAEKEVI